MAQLPRTMTDAIRGAVQQDMSRTPQAAPVSQQPGPAGESVEDRRRRTIQEAVQQDLQQQGAPEMRQRSGLGAEGQPAPTFGDSYRAGTDQLRSSLDYTRALVGDLIGDNEMFESALSSATLRDEISGGMMSGGTTFQDFVNDPSLGGGLQFAKQTLGQLSPMMLESVAGAAAGALVGTITAPGPGTVQGAATGLAAKTLIRQAVKNRIVNEVQDASTDAAKNRVLSAALRAQAAQRGAYIGTAAAEFRQGVGETYRETVEAGDPSPMAAIGTAAPFALVGFLPDKLVVDSLTDAIRGADPATRSAVKELLKQVAVQTPAQAGSEAAQEEILIRLHDSLTEEDYAGSSEANWRRAEAGAAGAVGGAAVGTISGGATAAANRMAAGRGPLVEPTPETQELGRELSTIIDTPSVELAGGARNMQEDETILPESQRDIDAQFNAMLSEDSAKQAVEITEGSPPPAGYSEGMEGVIRVDTPNGYVLTTEPSVAQDIEQNEGSIESIARALGYRNTKDEAMTRAVVARDNEGSVVHSELISPSETVESATARAQQFAPNVAIEDAGNVLTERADRVRAEGRDPEFEYLERQVTQTTRRLEQLQRSADVLTRARRSAEFIERWSEIDRKIPEIRDEMARTQQALQTQSRAMADLQARNRQQRELDTARRQNDLLVQEAMVEANFDDPNVSGGIEATVDATGEVVTIPREVYEDIASRFRTRNQGENIGLDDDQVAQRIADEFAERGIHINQTDARPITVEPADAAEVNSNRVSEKSLNSADPRAFERDGENVRSRTQYINRQHRLGPNTEATIVDGVRAPVSAVRQLRKLRQQFPEDTWSLATWTDDNGRLTYQVKRERSFNERGGDDPVVRDVEGTDSDALDASRTRDDGLTVSPDPAISTTVRERIARVAAQARWRHGLKQPPEQYSLRMIDPEGREGFYNIRQIGNAGMDVNQYLIADNVPEVERRQMGVLSAITVLSELGFKVYPNTVPDSYLARRSRTRRQQAPAWTRVAGDWDILLPEDRFNVLRDNGVTEINGSDIADMSEGQISDISAKDLPESLHDAVREYRFDRYGNERPEFLQKAPITNRDTQNARTLARVGSGVQMDALIHPTLRDIFAQAKEEAGLQSEVFVITDQTSQTVLDSMPPDVNEAVKTHPYLAPLITQPPSNLRGRTVVLPNGKAIIWINSRLSGELKSMALAHELGHVAFHEHQVEIMSDEPRARKLLQAYEQARAEGHVKQYNDAQLGFEEWFADRFSAWVHNRQPIRPDNMPRIGKFRKLYRTIRAVARRLQVNATKLQMAGNSALYARIQPDEVVNSFFDGISKVAPKRRAIARKLRQKTEVSLEGLPVTRAQPDVRRNDPMRDVMDEMAYQAELDQEIAQLRGEIDAATQDVDFRPSIIGKLDDNDPMANTQKERVERNGTNGLGNKPEYPGDRGDSSNLGERREFASEPEQGPADPAPGQRFEAEPEQGPADPAPRQEFDRQPQEGGAGGGQGNPPGGGEPPTSGPADGPDGFDQDPIARAIGERARNWAGTETFADVLRWINENMPQVLRRGLKALRDLTFTDDARLRSHGAVGRKIANWFYDDTYDRNTTGPRGYLNAVEMELARRMAEVEQLMPDNRNDADAALREAQSGRPDSELSDDAMAIRRYLKQFFREYLRPTFGRDINMRNNYFPRVYDVGQIVARADEFRALLLAAGYSMQEANGIMQAIMEGESSVEMSTYDQEGSGPGMSSQTERTVNKLSDADLQQHGFVVEPRAALMQYLRSAVKRVEYEKRFAGEMSLEEVYQDMLRRRAAGKRIDEDYFNSIQQQYSDSADPRAQMIKDPSARLKKEINRLPEEERPEVRRIIENYMGRSNTLFGHELPPIAAKTISGISGVMYMATLGLASISQITDFGAIVLRTRGAEGIGMMHRAISQMPRDERLAFARAVGSISEQANLDALRMTFGNDFMTPTMRRWTDTFFKVIGLEQFTNFSRSIATVMGAEFVKTHAIKAAAGEQRSARYLQELRLTPQQVFEWESNGQRFDNDAGNAVREALFQFTDESVLRPNAAMRPGWASNPWFTLMWQLKSFAWGFYKVVMRGLANEVKQRRNEGADITDMVAPMAMTGALMLPLAFTTMVIKDIAKEGLNSAFDDDEYQWNTARNRSATEWMLELSDRSGLLGPWAIVNSAFDAHGWGDNPALALMGPAAEKSGHLIKGDLGRVANDLIPVAGLVR